MAHDSLMKTSTNNTKRPNKTDAGEVLAVFVSLADDETRLGVAVWKARQNRFRRC